VQHFLRAFQSTRISDLLNNYSESFVTCLVLYSFHNKLATKLF